MWHMNNKIDFPIGSLAWAKVLNVKGNSITLPQKYISYDKIDTWQSFLVIGRSDYLRCLLTPDIMYSDTLGMQSVTNYQIDQQYLGQKIYYISSNRLKYFGRTCSLCQEKFDYLSNHKTFTCWRCEI